jgi:DNA-binding LacI/PurR family transcriptional regulator
MTPPAHPAPDDDDPPALPETGPGPRERALGMLRRIIEEGRLAVGMELPSSRELGRSLDIPHATVYRALRELEAQGLIERTAWGARRVLGASGLAADLDRERIRPGDLAETVVVFLLGAIPVRNQAMGWSDRQILGAMDRINELGQRSLLVHLRNLRPGDLDLLIAGKPLGVVMPEVELAFAQSLPVIDRLRAAGVPLVIGGEHPDLAAIDSVSTDHAVGAGLLVDWLYARGRRHLAQLLGDTPQVTWLDHRRAGYEAACRRHGLTVYPRRTFTGAELIDDRHDHEWDVNHWYATGALWALLRDHPAIDGILACTDPDVLLLAPALRELGRKPDDILLVGYDHYADGTWEAEYEKARPAATIDKDNLAMGAAMADLLMRRRRGHLSAAPAHLRHPPRLIVRPP